MALRPISRVSDYAFPDGAWDVRGWRVRTGEDAEKVGKVDDMLLDGSGALRYLDVDLGLLKKHILVPLEHARADAEEKTVWVDGLTQEQLEEVPEYALEPEALDTDFERRLDAVYGGSSARAHRDLVAPEDHPDGNLDLRRMADLEKDYRVAGEDPRGWTVVAADGNHIGRVAGLLMDPSEMRARFLDVAVDEEKLDLEPVDRHILLPVDRIRLARSKKRVIVGGLLAGDLADYPQYGGLPVSRRTEPELNAIFARAGMADTAGAGGAGREEADARELPDWRTTALQRFYGPAARPRTRTTEEERHG